MKNKILFDFLNDVSDYPDWIGVGDLDLFSRSVYGDTLLHVAAVQGRADLVCELLRFGLDINAKGENGYTPLHEAVEQENYLIALILIRMGADLSAKNDFGNCPLDSLSLDLD